MMGEDAMNPRRVLVAIPAAAMLMAAVSAAPATAEDVLQVGSQATLVAKGVAVDVPVTYTCTSPSEWSENRVALHVAQVVRGQQVTVADTEIAAFCDGTAQAATVRVTVPTGSSPFKSGTALVDATLSMMDMMSPTIYIHTSQEVRFSR
jgi:hypothetical protein